MIMFVQTGGNQDTQEKLPLGNVLIVMLLCMVIRRAIGNCALNTGVASILPSQKLIFCLRKVALLVLL